MNFFRELFSGGRGSSELESQRREFESRRFFLGAKLDTLTMGAGQRVDVTLPREVSEKLFPQATDAKPVEVSILKLSEIANVGDGQYIIQFDRGESPFLTLDLWDGQTTLARETRSGGLFGSRRRIVSRDDATPMEARMHALSFGERVVDELLTLQNASPGSFDNI